MDDCCCRMAVIAGSIEAGGGVGDGVGEEFSDSCWIFQRI